MKEEINKARRALIQFYLTVKIRKEEEADDITKEQLAEEETKIEHLSLMTLVNYIKSSIDTIITLKLEEAQSKAKPPLSEDNSNAARLYETLLRKEESEIRQHISAENQLKIHIEKISEDLEEITKENAILKKKLKNSNRDELQIREEQIMKSQSNEIESLKKLVQSYEDREVQNTVKEKKYKLQLIEKEKEIKRLESKLLSRKSSSFVLVEKEREKLRDKEALSSNSSINSNSQSKRKVEDKQKGLSRDVSPMPIEKTQLMDKLEKYRKLIDKKVSDVTRNKTYILRERSCASVSYNLKEKMENEMSLIMPKTDLAQKFNNQKKASDGDLHSNNVIVKKIPLPNSNSSHKKEGSSKKKQSTSSNADKSKVNSLNTIPILINPSEVPCGNNINIIAGNTTYHIEQRNDVPKNANQLNLRQYIFTQYGTARLINKIKSNSKG